MNGNRSWYQPRRHVYAPKHHRNHITEKLLEGAVQTLQEHGVGLPKITIKRVPGSFELIYGAAQLAKHGHVNAVIAIGCVVRGDTPHFDYICEGVTRGLADAS